MYRDKKLTPEETSLLDGPISHRYTSHQESDAKIDNNSDIGKGIEGKRFKEEENSTENTEIVHWHYIDDGKGGEK